MGDLISRSALIENFRKCYSGHMGMENSDSTMMFKSICRVINEQPIAYDVEKVAEELEEERGISYADFDEYAYRYELDLTDNDDWFYKGLARAIDIVKRGGVE